MKISLIGAKNIMTLLPYNIACTHKLWVEKLHPLIYGICEVITNENM
jgi:hypothetical protein